MEPVLQQLADAVSQSDSLEDLVRPLLEILEGVSGLETTYLTAVDATRGHQRILFSRNTRSMEIPEGLSVPWGDTLCKRALEEGRPYSAEVDSRWGDSDAARELGIQSYLSEPVRIGDGELFGTLCGASASRVSVSEETQRLLQLFSTVIARQIEHDRLIRELRAQNRDFMAYALTDPLTGVANRRALDREIRRALTNKDRSHHAIHIAFIDLDGFKAINDQFGHDAGDRFLIEMTRHLSSGLRQGDMLARYGGDEFVVVGTSREENEGNARAGLKRRIIELTSGTFDIGTARIDYGGPSIGVITIQPDEMDADKVLDRADKAMYEVKKRRRQTSGRRPH